MRKLVLAAMCAASLSLTNCPLAHMEPLRSSNLQTYSVRELGLIHGKTDFASARAAMKRRKMTGIAEDFYVKGGKIFHAITADYQGEIHLFEDNLYKGSIPVKCGSVLPYGYQLRIGESKGRVRLLALYRDPLEYTFEKKLAAPARIDVFTHEGSFRHLKTISLKSLSEAHGGLTRPVFVGHDMDVGIIFLARNNHGAVWQKAYLISVTDETTSIKSVPLSEAAKCSCVQDYIYRK